ncbi:MAG TPA: hypothetical protein PKD85_09030 [Saprospiraceae bacterium]|nr:hypothetical protein [Saprospiraceae bacterium]
MKNIFITVSLFVSFNLMCQNIITQWSFEDTLLTPSLGMGTAKELSTTFTFATGNGGGRGWNSTSYQNQSIGSGTSGVQFSVSTLGFKNIKLSFDHRASGTASRWAQLDYSIDGGKTWVTNHWRNGGGLSPHDVFYSFDVDFSGIDGANDNPNFTIRIVSIFSPQAFSQNATLNYGANEAYMRANAQAVIGETGGTGTGNYGAGGTWRFDNVTFKGETLPLTFVQLTSSNKVKILNTIVDNQISLLSNYESGKMEILDNTGNIVKSVLLTTGNNEVYANELSKGVYLVFINGQFLERVIKI